MNELERIRLAILTSLEVDVKDKKRDLDVVEGKRIYCYIARKNTSLSLKEISFFIGLTHASVIHHINKAKDFFEYDISFVKKYNKVVDFIPEYTDFERYKKLREYHHERFIYYGEKLNRLQEKISK